MNVPLLPSLAEKLQKVQGPPEKTEEARALERRCGFSCRNLLGELMCACVIVRLDVGHSVCFLARFSAVPHEDHFRALKGVCKYLRSMKSWGIMHHRPSPRMDLPCVPFEFVEEDPNLPPCPSFHRDELVGLLDAAHATDL